jgi:hypothetical protein
MGEHGRRRIISTLAWEHSVPQLLRAYGEGLGISIERQQPFDEVGESPPSATTTNS